MALRMTKVASLEVSRLPLKPPPLARKYCLTRKHFACQASLLPSPPLTPRPAKTSTLPTRLSSLDIIDTVEFLESFDSDDEGVFDDYREATTGDLVQARLKWLVFFSVGLVISAGVVQDFDELLQTNPALSCFLPLIIGYAGNSGSQTTCAIIRALALRQVRFRQILVVIAKESAAGAIMGTLIGGAIYALTQVTHAVSPDVGLCLFLSLPVVSVWSNALGAFLALTSDKLKLDAALTAAPLMTTIVDSTGLVIYFVISDLVIRGAWGNEVAQLALAMISATPSLADVLTSITPS